MSAKANGGAVATLTPTDPALIAFAEEVGDTGAVAVEGRRTRWDLGGTLSEGARLVSAPSGIVDYAPNEMTVTVRAGTTVAELNAVLAGQGQRTALPDRGGTVGGALVVGENDVRALGRGLLRTALLQVRYVSAEGRIVSSGGPTVKNVSGFDLPRLVVGSLGTLGLVAEVILRTNPIPATSQWFSAPDADPLATYDTLLAPSAVLWDGSTTWVELEGHRADVEAEHSRLAALASYRPIQVPIQVPIEVPIEVGVEVGVEAGVDVAAGVMAGEADAGHGAALPVTLPTHRWSLTPAEAAALGETADERGIGRFVAAIGLGLAFADKPQPARPVSPELDVVAMRLKENFDPTGRLNPGRDPGRK